MAVAMPMTTASRRSESETEVYSGRPGIGQLDGREPGPVGRPRVDDVADAGRQQTGDEGGDEHRALWRPGLEHEERGVDRVAEDAGDGGEAPRRRQQRGLGLAAADDEGDGQPERRAERDERRLRAEHRAARQGDQRGQHDAADLARLGGYGAEALRGVVPAVAGKQARRRDEQATDGRDEEDPPPRGAESPRLFGIVVHKKSVRCCSSHTKPRASRATGMPMSAAITRDWT